MFSTSGRLAPESIDCVKVFSAGSASLMRADCCHGAMRACCQRSTVPGPLSVAPDRRSGPQQNLQRHASAGFCAVRGGKKGPAAVGPAIPSPAAPAPATHGLDQRALRHVQSASPLRPPKPVQAGGHDGSNAASPAQPPARQRGPVCQSGHIAKGPAACRRGCGSRGNCGRPSHSGDAACRSASSMRKWLP